MSKTYDELYAEAADRWRQNSHAHASKQNEIERTIAESPDVISAPSVGTLYTHPEIVCSICRGTDFTVRRYGCINGVRDKATLSCQSCATTMTWSWPEMTWLS